MDNYQTVSGDGCSILNYSTLANAIGALKGNNYYGCITQNQQMKESKKELFKIVFKETIVSEHSYEVLAESEEDAKKYLGGERTVCADVQSSNSKLVSKEIVQI